MLLVVWVGGLTTIGLLWLWVFVSFFGFGYDLALHQLLAYYAVAPVVGLHILWLSPMLVLGLLLKVLSQPFHFLLLNFYRLLPPVVLAVYLSAYYVMLLLVLILFILNSLLFVAQGVFFFGGVIFLGIVFNLAGNFQSLTDFRVVLVFSTILNLALLFVGVATL